MMESTTAGEFIAYPTNRVVGTISDGDQTEHAVEALVKAGFDRGAIEVLHGDQDVRRLDPSGDEHGIFAKLQRTLVRGAVGSELKHLTHHVGDLRAGRFVVMVLAPERRNRDVAADILHAHGAEFVGFYGRWAYESLPEESPEAPPTEKTYDIEADQETIRVRIGGNGATIVGATSLPAVATAVGASLWLISWRRNETVIVHAIDVERGIAYTSLTPRDSAPKHVKGTVTVVG
jgi:hypothetical protein